VDPSQEDLPDLEEVGSVSEDSELSDVLEMAIDNESSPPNVPETTDIEPPKQQPPIELPVPDDYPPPSSKPEAEPVIESDQESPPDQQLNNMNGPDVLKRSSDEDATNQYLGTDAAPSSPEHHVKHVKVELNPFQLLLSPAMVSALDEMELLRVTKHHLSNNFLADDATFRRLEVFHLLRDGQGAKMEVDGYTMVAFGGNSYFEKHVSVDRVRAATMLAFLGTNLTDYTVMLYESAVSVSDAQLYTLDGHMVEYSDGVMHIQSDFPEEEAMNSMMSVTMYIVAIGIPAMICGLICLGYCLFQLKSYNLWRPKNVDPEHETWKAQSWYHDDDDLCTIEAKRVPIDVCIYNNSSLVL
jgi:hypothetical protein